LDDGIDRMCRVEIAASAVALDWLVEVGGTAGAQRAFLLLVQPQTVNTIAGIFRVCRL
jgi:hypothetical protein